MLRGCQAREASGAGDQEMRETPSQGADRAEGLEPPITSAAPRSRGLSSSFRSLEALASGQADMGRDKGTGALMPL